ncbi:MAG: TonB-dependent receptor plug domain-containing protein [Gemmatimonadetes bacterium]|nr:TonB-dependent receptor plug domain-containing protein [Gemmatimonadota bacterium]
MARSQTDTTARKRDSLRVHQLSEIVVHGVHAVPAPLPYTIVEIEPRALKQIDAVAVADIARLVPAARIQTNSRGETLVYLRNAGERQVAAFLDGALLNVPWDNRVDLSLVPASMIAGVSVVQGVPPVEYGTNVLGGAVNLTSPSWGDASEHVEIGVTAGTGSQLQGSLAARGSSGPWTYAAAFGHSTRDGLPLPAAANLPFSQPDPDLRTNTDARITNASGRLVHQFAGGTEVGLSVFHLDAEKGVAPEGHKDPAVSNVRFWRYPVWRNTMGILSARGTLGAAAIWKGAAWMNRFRQTIDSYASVSYDSLESREEDHDLTVGGRLVAQRGIGSSAFKLALNGLTSTHKQRDLDLEPRGQPVAGQPFSQLTYQQVVLSTGAEYEVDPIERLDLTLGASFDAMFAPSTGDKPSIDPFTDYSVTLGAGYRIDGGWQLRLGAGRKSRFPTMRELFGEALNRFPTQSGSPAGIIRAHRDRLGDQTADVPGGGHPLRHVHLEHHRPAVGPGRRRDPPAPPAHQPAGQSSAGCGDDDHPPSRPGCHRGRAPDRESRAPAPGLAERPGLPLGETVNPWPPGRELHAAAGGLRAGRGHVHRPGLLAGRQQPVRAAAHVVGPQSPSGIPLRPLGGALPRAVPAGGQCHGRAGGTAAGSAGGGPGRAGRSQSQFLSTLTSTTQ